jgi:dTMP kinase
VGLPRPDVVVFLSLGSEVAAQRGGYGEERYEKEEIQRRVREVFTKLQRDERDAGDWHVVDAGADVDEVARRIWDVVEPVIETVGNKQIRSIQ